MKKIIRSEKKEAKQLTLEAAAAATGGWGIWSTSSVVVCYTAPTGGVPMGGATAQG